jgi:imidazolonepropionase-like amidohydrolase
MTGTKPEPTVNKRTIRAIGLAWLILGLWQGAVANPAERPILIRGGRIITIAKGTLESGSVLIQGGRIAAVGPDLTAPKDALIIDAVGDFILPGFIDASTNLGFVEWETVEKDDDEAATTLTPQIRAIDAFYPDNKLIPEALRQGVTTALIAPARGNLLSGQSALVHLDGGDVAGSTLLFPAAVHGTLGDIFKPRSKANTAAPYTRMGAAALLRQTLVDARAYRDQLRSSAGPKPSAQPMLDALAAVLGGERPLVVTANRMDDILTALRIAREFGIRIVIGQGAEAWRVRDQLAKAKVPVLLMPKTASGLSVETAGGRHDNPALLREGGVTIAFQTGSVQNVGDLLSLAQDAVRYGLPVGEALRALTISPAEIFGVADAVGSLEKGKMADIVIFSGHPILSPARVKTVIINGRIVFGSIPQ